MDLPPIQPDPRDGEHLKALVIAHYVMAGLTALFALLPLLHVGLGLMMLFDPGQFGGKGGQEPPPAFLGWFFVAIGSAFILLGQTCAFCLFLSGRWMKQRRRYLFSFVVACIACALFPFGTALGVFTILVLSRDSVKRLYDRTF